MDKAILELLEHQEHKQWISRLNLYQDEIKIFQNELLLVMAKHPDLPSIFEMVNEYKEFFLKKLEKIDVLRHQIMIHDRAYSVEGNCNEEHHAKTKESMQEIETNFENLKARFRMFASHND